MSDLKTAHRTYKYKLLLSKSQHARLEAICESQRILYNAALQERIDCYKKTGKGRSYRDQCKAVTVLRKDPEYSNVPANLQRWTLMRLNHAYEGFFKRGGFPRYRGKERWKSFGFAEFIGISFNGTHIAFKGINGKIRVLMHRVIKGEIKSCAFRRDTKGWYICFQCEIPLEIKDCAESQIGIDVGIESFATLSNGLKISNPRIGRRTEKELRLRQRALSRCKKGSNRRRKMKNKLARTHEKLANTRQTFLHQQSVKIVRQYSIIAVEDLKIRNMIRNHCLARSIQDAGWGAFIKYLSYKAEEAGGKVIKVNPKNTSQVCSGCGVVVPKKLKDRIHNCPDCGLSMDRDENAAVNILSRGGIVPELANVA